MAGVDAVVHLVAIPRDLRGGADLRLVNTEGTRAVIAAMWKAGVKRLVHMGAMGVEDDPNLHYASSKAKAEGLVRDSGLDWTILKPSLQFGPGDGFFNIVAGLVRISPGIVPGAGRRVGPLPADPCRPTWPRSPSGSSPTRRRSAPRSSSAVRATGRTRRSRARSKTALGKRRVIVPMPIVLIRLVAGAAELVHIPFPVATDQLRQLRLDNIGPLDLIPTRFGFEPRSMEGALGYLRAKPRDQVVGGA